MLFCSLPQISTLLVRPCVNVSLAGGVAAGAGAGAGAPAAAGGVAAESSDKHTIKLAKRSSRIKTTQQATQQRVHV